MFRIMKSFVLSLLIFLDANNSSFAQTTSLSAAAWEKKLSDPADKENKWFYDLYPVLDKLDSSSVFSFLNQLGSNSPAKGNYFIARFNCIKAEMLHIKNLPGYPNAFVFTNERVKKQIINLLEEAKVKSYECNDDYLAAFVSCFYGRHMADFGQTEAAVMYMMNSADLYEKVHIPAEFGVYAVLGELLWKVREYEKCIKYTRKAIELLPTLDENRNKMYTKFCRNTMGLAFHRLGQYDSAFAWYRQGLDAVEKNNDTLWTAIISGNMAQIYFAQEKYTTALPLFELDYKMNNVRGYFDNAANALQWVARTNLALGKTEIALQQVREAFELLQKSPSRNYLQNAYFTAAEIFKTLKNDDSSFYYSALYNKLHDSLEKEIYQSSVSIIKLRLDDEKNKYNIMNLQREKQSQLFLRNIVIISILLLSVFALLVVNRQRLKEKLKTEEARQEKLRMEQEVASAKDQLKVFTEHIIEKTNLIEKLESQVRGKEASEEQQTIISELSQQTILTEEDWERFKSVFEKIYPGFFGKLISKSFDITAAEQRMAALTRLNFTTKQIAPMLGISVDSVHKTRQRLRQRLQLSPEANLKEFIANF